jgi:predicted CopG family antitoxin
MRTTVTLDEDVYEAAMQMAQVSGERFGKVLSELAGRGLNPPVVAATPRKKAGHRAACA